MSKMNTNAARIKAAILATGKAGGTMRSLVREATVEVACAGWAECGPSWKRAGSLQKKEKGDGLTVVKGSDAEKACRDFRAAMRDIHNMSVSIRFDSKGVGTVKATPVKPPVEPSPAEKAAKAKDGAITRLREVISEHGFSADELAGLEAILAEARAALTAKPKRTPTKRKAPAKKKTAAKKPSTKS